MFLIDMIDIDSEFWTWGRADDRGEVVDSEACVCDTDTVFLFLPKHLTQGGLTSKENESMHGYIH